MDHYRTHDYDERAHAARLATPTWLAEQARRLTADMEAIGRTEDFVLRYGHDEAAAALGQLAQDLEDAIGRFRANADKVPEPNTYDATAQADADLHAYKARAL
jgi:hypothetical protein